MLSALGFVFNWSRCSEAMIRACDSTGPSEQTTGFFIRSVGFEYLGFAIRRRVCFELATACGSTGPSEQTTGFFIRSVGLECCLLWGLCLIGVCAFTRACGFIGGYEQTTGFFIRWLWTEFRILTRDSVLD
jgi:hypothetical protein